MLFCPTCSNILLTEKTVAGEFRFYCKTCPYVFKVEHQIEEKKYLIRKEVDDVLGGADAWKDVNTTEKKCEIKNCSNDQAYFKAIQMRSADEPETIFYRCTKCHNVWNEAA